MYKCSHFSMYVHIYSTYVWVCVCVYIRTYIRTYHVCKYVCTYVHTYLASSYRWVCTFFCYSDSGQLWIHQCSITGYTVPKFQMYREVFRAFENVVFHDRHIDIHDRWTIWCENGFHFVFIEIPICNCWSWECNIQWIIVVMSKVMLCTHIRI